MGVLPAGLYRNRSFAESSVDAGEVELAVQDLLFDPQTSGGLLMAADPGDAESLLARPPRLRPERAARRRADGVSRRGADLPALKNFPVKFSDKGLSFIRLICYNPRLKSGR